MSIPTLIGLLVLGIVVAATAGVWRARRGGPANVQSSIAVLAAVVVVAVIVWLVLGR